jgi:hypothetical protein
MVVCVVTVRDVQPEIRPEVTEKVWEILKIVESLKRLPPSLRLLRAWEALNREARIAGRANFTDCGAVTAATQAAGFSC